MPDLRKSHNNNRKKKKALWLTIAILLLIIALFSLYLLYKLLFPSDPEFDKYKKNGKSSTSGDAEITTYVYTEDTSDPNDTASDSEKAPPKDPVPEEYDFEGLQTNENDDIYAWIVVPGTQIDYPIVQHPTDANFYLRRDYKGNPDVCGCIFTQNYNRKDFTDPNTIIYGHYMTNGKFFGDLHKFRDAKFFREHEYFYIHTPGHIYTYLIFAAYEYDGRHILYAFDFSDEEVFAEYLESCLDPKTVARNVREDVTLTTENRIVTLSTCVQSGADDKRYLVQGVLIDDQPTE